MKRVVFAMATLGLVASSSAGAVTVSFGGRVEPNETAASHMMQSRPGGIVSAFTTEGGGDIGAGSDSFGFSSDPFPGEQPNGCVNTASLSSTAGLTRIPLQDARGVGLAPTGGDNCYLNVDRAIDPDTGEVQPIGFADYYIGSLDSNNDLVQSTYAGFLWGSVDAYNAVEFLDVNDQPVTSLGYGSIGSNAGVITGLDVYLAMNPGGTAADLLPLGLAPNDPKRNFYINFQFADTDPAIYSIRFIANGNCCFEIDNVVGASDPVVAPSFVTPLLRTAQLATVPEPASVALFGLATLAFAMRRRLPTRTLPR